MPAFDNNLVRTDEKREATPKQPRRRRRLLEKRVKRLKLNLSEGERGKEKRRERERECVCVHYIFRIMLQLPLVGTQATSQVVPWGGTGTQFASHHSGREGLSQSLLVVVPTPPAPS